MKSIVIDRGMFKTQVWETEEGWRFDGPACNGPKHVRESGRGPWWKGPVEKAHVDELVAAAREHGMDVVEREI
jgi:hypothetical protein